MSEVVVRFAPSPTGSLHIGGARTALYNWLWARHGGGRMLLRIEDTDTERSTEDNIRIILDGLRWLGIDWDAPPVFQTQRLAMYRPLIERMLAEGTAYRCTCAKEELDAKRETAIKEKGKYLYDRKCRDANHGPDCGVHTVRIKMPVDGTITVQDIILGEVVFPAPELDDWIIARPDGMPTYNFAVVADDHDMGITHVIRGADHLANTPKQVVVYQLLGYTMPAFAHMPLTHGPDGKKLSKRHGATSVTDFAQLGFMAQAVRNYLVRLGWSHGDQELFTDEEMIRLFDLRDCNASPGIMDMKKLAWVNAQKMRTLSPEVVGEELLPFLKAQGYPAEAGEWLNKLIVNTRERFENFADLAAHVRYFYFEPTHDPAVAKKWFTPENASLMSEIADALQNLGDFSEGPIEEIFKRICDAKGLGLGKVAQPIRVAVSGGTVSPPIYETLALLGREKTLARIRKAIELAGG
jgi:glutamyl-tRNA synthetase